MFSANQNNRMQKRELFFTWLFERTYIFKFINVQKMVYRKQAVCLLSSAKTTICLFSVIFFHLLPGVHGKMFAFAVVNILKQYTWHLECFSKIWRQLQHKKMECIMWMGITSILGVTQKSIGLHLVTYPMIRGFFFCFFFFTNTCIAM